MKSTKYDPATGTSNEGFSRGSNKYSGNHSDKKMKGNFGRGPTGGGTKVPSCGCDSINMGRGPTKGNQQ